MNSREDNERSVLVVDDNPDFLQSLTESLETLGFCVDAFISADAATAALTPARLSEFDAVLTDFEMPGTNGEVFAKRMRDLNPDSKIYIISGGLSGVSGAASEHATLVQKPVSISGLVAELDKLL